MLEGCHNTSCKLSQYLSVICSSPISLWISISSAYKFLPIIQHCWYISPSYVYQYLSFFVFSTIPARIFPFTFVWWPRVRSKEFQLVTFGLVSYVSFLVMLGIMCTVYACDAEGCSSLKDSCGLEKFCISIHKANPYVLCIMGILSILAIPFFIIIAVTVMLIHYSCCFSYDHDYTYVHCDWLTYTIMYAVMLPPRLMSHTVKYIISDKISDTPYTRAEKITNWWLRP